MRTVTTSTLLALLTACSDGRGGGKSDTDADTDVAVDTDASDDTDANAYPGASEYCDDIDNDCDGTVDNDAVDQTTWYLDADADSYGDPAVSVYSCEPDGYVANADDCDDTESTTAPGVEDTCDGVDNDCDGTTDEDCG